MRLKNGFVLRDVLGVPTVVGEGVEQVHFNKIISFNAPAAYLWKSVEGKEFSSETLADLLCRRYEVSREEAEADAADLLSHWAKNGLVDL